MHIWISIILSFKYSKNFESPLIRGSEEIRSWDFIEQVSTHVNTNNNLIDIGCDDQNWQEQLSGLRENAILEISKQETEKSAFS